MPRNRRHFAGPMSTSPSSKKERDSISNQGCALLLVVRITAGRE